MDRTEYFLELFGCLPRGGPGDNASTRRAFRMMEHLPPDPTILDLGCGPGMQTVELLRLSGGRVVALDRLPQMIARVRRAAERAGLAERLETVRADMSAMTFEPSSFDAIWSEGAIYVLGFEHGLERVKALVRPGGYVAVTEPVWLAPEAPREVIDFWRQYREIDTVHAKLEILSKLGYEPVGHFVLPESSWIDEYYDPLAKRVADCERTWTGIREAEQVLREARSEMAMFRKHARYYGYAFFVMRR